MMGLPGTLQAAFAFVAALAWMHLQLACDNAALCRSRAEHTV